MKRHSAKLRLLEILLFLACALEGVLFFKEGLSLREILPQSATPSKTQTAILEIIQKQGSVRLKSSDSLLQKETTLGELITAAANLSTRHHSNAKIELTEGTSLELDEDTSLDISKANAVFIDMKSGTIHKRETKKTSQLLRRLGGSTPKLLIRCGDRWMDVKPELLFSFSCASGGRSKITLHQGETEVHVGKNLFRLKSGDILDGEGVHSITFDLLSPLDREAIEADQDLHLRFRWNLNSKIAANRAQELIIQPQTTGKALKFLIAATEPPLNYVEVSVLLPSNPQNYLWSVHFLPDSSEESEKRSLSIRPRAYPKPRFPLNEVEIDKKSTLGLVWGPVNEATAYEVDILGLKNIRTRDLFAEIRELPEGIARWRVRALLKNGGTTAWSEVRSVRIR